MKSIKYLINVFCLLFSVMVLAESKMAEVPWKKENEVFLHQGKKLMVYRDRLYYLPVNGKPVILKFGVKKAYSHNQMLFAFQEKNPLVIRNSDKLLVSHYDFRNIDKPERNALGAVKDLWTVSYRKFQGLNLSPNGKAVFIKSGDWKVPFEHGRRIEGFNLDLPVGSNAQKIVWDAERNYYKAVKTGEPEVVLPSKTTTTFHRPRIFKKFQAR